MNRYHPLQYVNNTQYNKVSTNPHDSNTQPLPLIPGSKLYSESVKNKTMIITDSMCGGVKGNDMKRNLNTNEKIIFRIDLEMEKVKIAQKQMKLLKNKTQQKKNYTYFISIECNNYHTYTYDEV